jgi:hypothetical protein
MKEKKRSILPNHTLPINKLSWSRKNSQLKPKADLAAKRWPFRQAAAVLML